jgi:DNA mismatch repair protein MutL
MSRIRILPEQVANKIAAGEVVERPASVVKELVENAIDAGARAVRVEVESGGKRLVRVSDDGTGMTHDDALLAFERHSTSKLRTADDLLSIATLGFRGEALPSIAAVSRLVLETRTAEDEQGPAPSGAGQGTRVEFAGGKLVGVKPAGVPVGTSVSVADLFYCVPARRKFLKSDTTELGHIASLVTHYALAHPDKQFVLRTPTQGIVNASPVTQLSERVYQLFGRQALAELLEIPPAEGPVRAAITEPELEPEERGAVARVRGFVSRPEVQRSNRNGIYIFINRRLVRDRLLLHAIHEAYRNVMPPNVFPVVLLFLDMPYEEVDVNVHPSKIEVRFRHQQFVHDFARDAIRHALVSARPIASFAAATSGPKGQPVGAAGYVGAEAPTRKPASEAAAGVGPMAPPRAAIPSELPGAEHSGFELTGGPERPLPQRFSFEPGQGIEIPGEPSAAGGFAQRFQEAAARQQDGGWTASPADAESITDLKPLGQVNASYIVAVNAVGLWIVDQHVAHERVLFEQHLRARREGRLTGQRLLMPIIVELSPRQLVIFEQIAEELRANGFEVEPIGPRSVAIQAAPAGISSADSEKLLTEILDGIEREAQAISMETLQAKIAASTACHAAIKVNTPLDQTKMEWLLYELARTECPMSCPHGRPVVLRYSLREIEKAFKRI